MAQLLPWLDAAIGGTAQTLGMAPKPAARPVAPPQAVQRPQVPSYPNFTAPRPAPLRVPQQAPQQGFHVPSVMSPQQQKAASWLQANGGPVNPNYQSQKVGLVQDIGAYINSNPALHQMQGVKTTAQIRAKLLDPNNPLSGQNLAMGSLGGEKTAIDAAAKDAANVARSVLHGSTVDHAGLPGGDHTQAIAQVQDRIKGINDQIAAHQAAFMQGRTEIGNNPRLNSVQKNSELNKLQASTNQTVNDLKTQIAPHQARLTQLDPQHLTPSPQNIPTPPVETAIPKGSAYVSPTTHIINPTLKQKAVGLAKQVAEPFTVPKVEPKPGFMGQTRAILADQRGGIDLNAPLGKDSAPQVGKTADEGKVFYHGTSNKDLKSIADLKAGRSIGKSSTNMTYITENPEIAKNFGDNVISSRVYGKHLDISKLGNNAWDDIKVPKDFADYKTTNMLSERSKRVFEQQYLRGQGDNRIIDATPEIHEYLKSKGYSTVTVPRVGSDVNGARTETVLIDQNALKPTPTPPKPVEVPKPELKIATNKFTQSVRTSPEISPTTQSIVDGTHAVKSNDVLKAGQEAILSKGLKQATSQVNSAMAKAPGKITDQNVADAIAVAKAHDAKGNFEDSARILNDLSDHLVHSGRAIQAASLLDRISPQGRLYAAMKQLKKAGVEITPKIEAGLKAATDKIKSLPEGSQARGYAGQELIHFVQNQIPSGRVDKLIGIWKAGLLTGMRTETGNAIGNAGNVAIKKAADLPAAAIDKAFSVFTGARTKTFTMKGLGTGSAEGIKAGAKYLKTGVDERNLENIKYDQKGLNYKNPALNAYVNGVFRVMGAADRPAYYAANKNALADLAKADGLNKGLKGADLKAHIDQTMKNPTDVMAQSAANTADKAVFANDTLLSKAAAGIRTGMSKSPAGSAAINIIMPFTKVPSSVVTQVFDYTPVGAAKELIAQASKGKFDQRAMSEAFGKATVGSAGPITLGLALSNAGLLTGAYPKDPKEQAAWKAEGKQPNSVLVAGKWRSLNYLSPYGPLLGMGENIAQAIKDGRGALGGIATAAGSGVQTALGQSFLQGVQGVLDAVNDPGRYGAKTLKNMVASVVPTLVGDVAKATDSLQRQSNSPGDAIAAKIPGARQSLLPSADSFGNNLPNGNSALTTLFDPTRPTTNVTNPLYGELNRLQSAKAGVFPITQKTIGSGNGMTKLTPEQVNQRQQLVGQQLTPLWNQIITSPGYAKLDDAHKQLALQHALTDVNSAVDRQMLAQVDPSKLTKPATASQVTVMNGKADPNSYINKATNSQTGGTTSAGSTPAATYQTHLIAYQNAVKAGTLTGAKQFSAQQSLNKEAITSQYPQPVLDFYNMSKSNMNAYFKQDPTNAKALYDQAKALDAQLGGTKFKTGLATKSTGRVAKAKAFKIPTTPKIAGLGKSPSFKVASIKTPKMPKLASYPKAPKGFKAPKVAKAKLPSYKPLALAKLPKPPKLA